MSMPAIARHTAVLAVLACLALVPSPAVAQDRVAPPSADELRNEYPLDARAGPRAEQTAAETSTSSPQGAQSGDSGIDAGRLLVLAVLAFAGGLALALVVRRWRNARPGWVASIAPALRHAGPVLTTAPAAMRPPRLTATQLWNEHGSAPQEQQRPAAQGPRGPVPPDRGRAWTAEVEWRQTEATCRFCVVARMPDGGEADTVAESPALEWPPAGRDGVQALTRAAERLEASLLAAGWSALGPGDAWYAKRFAWEPEPAQAQWVPPAVGAAPRQAAPPGRFQRRAAWPKGADSLWRCEITWDAGYVKSRFRAIVNRPGQRRGHDIGSSVVFKWQLMSEPDPNSPLCRAEVRRLALVLEGLGWQHVGRGTAWYSERFVWRGEGEPLDRIEPVTVDARRAS